MKNIGETLIPLFLAVTLTACNSVVSSPTMNPADILETPISVAEIEIIMTPTANPTATYLPIVTQSPFSTIVPPTPTKIPLEAYADKLDYAMATAQPIYLLFPYILEASFYSGEYAGCTETNDFQTLVLYELNLPLETVKLAFLTYFKTENWQSTEETSSDNITTITYDVSRISAKDISVSERLKVILLDESARFGEDHIFVRTELTHIETKENINYLSAPYGIICLSKAQWLEIRLKK